MDAIGERISRDYPDSNKSRGVGIDPHADTVVNTQPRSSLHVLLGRGRHAAAHRLCGTWRTPTLDAGTAREREVALRAALGAGRGRLVRQFLTENVLLAAIGGLLGLLLGYGMMAGLKQALPPFMLPSDVGVTMDGRVLAFTLALSVVTGVIFGLAPAAARDQAGSRERDEGRRPRVDGRFRPAPSARRARRHRGRAGVHAARRVRPCCCAASSA